MKRQIQLRKPLFTIVRALLFCVCCAASLALTSAYTMGLPGIWSPILSVTLAAICGLGLSLLFIRWDGLTMQDIGLLPGHRTFPHMLTGLIIGSTMVIIQLLMVFGAGHVKMMKSPQAEFVTIGCNLLLYLLIACREEIAFRGYPLRSLDQKVGRWTAQLVVGAIFIAEHVIGGMTLFQAIIGSGMGACLFGLAALRSKGIALPLGIHTAWNFGQWALGLKTGNGIYKLLVEKGYHYKVELFGWIGYVIAMGCAIAFIYFRKVEN